MSKIQHYTILSQLGQGGMATVHLALDNKFDSNVAIKLLNTEYTHNENIRKRFLAEAKSMFRMSHPNIIKVTDLIEDGDTVAFVMEYVEGETLKEYIERKVKLSNEEIKSIFSQMLDAVGYVHEQNLVHRDIKPSNFMLDKKGKVKLMDFGIAKNTDSNSAEYTQTGTGMQMGTPMYMSPEQITETKSVTAQSDIYSLGVVLWQMVIGSKPYDMKTLSTFQLQMKIVQEDLPKTNTNWDKIIEKATQKEIEKRFSDSRSFKDAIYTTSQNTNKKLEIDDEQTILENKTEKEESKEKLDIKKKENNHLPNFQFDTTIFLQLLNKYQIKKDRQSARDLILFPEINEKKEANFISKFQNLLITTIKEYRFLLLHDDTLFGKCDEGFAILLGDESKLLILISEDNKPLHISTINFDHHVFPRIKDINVKGVFSTRVEVILNNSITISYKTQVGNTLSNFEIFAKHFIAIFNSKI